MEFFCASSGGGGRLEDFGKRALILSTTQKQPAFLCLTVLDYHYDIRNMNDLCLDFMHKYYFNSHIMLDCA